jgi:hypothetical protein
MPPGALYGGVQAGLARGLALRMDPGLQYLSNHFKNLAKLWGSTPASPSFWRPMPTKGGQAFQPNFKEQAIYGRVFRSVEDIRQAVRNFVEIYYNQWRVEKNAFKNPQQPCQDWLNDRLVA